MPLTNTHAEFRRLANLRRRARTHELSLRSCRRPLSKRNRGGLTLVDLALDAVIAGDAFDLTLAEAETAVAHEIARQIAEATEASIPF